LTLKIEDLLKRFNRSRSRTETHAGIPLPSCEAVPFTVSEIDFLFTELESRRANVAALQKKLTACRNIGEQKDAMIARRDRSIAKAHQYIEVLKTELRGVKEVLAQKASESPKEED